MNNRLCFLELFFILFLKVNFAFSQYSYSYSFAFKLYNNDRIVDIVNYNPDYSEIYSREILKRIANQQSGWEVQLPDGVPEMIKERGMFGYKDPIEIKEL